MKTKNKGFTLVELMVVIGILTVILAIVLIAVNPSRQLSKANDTQRRSDVSAILSAVYQYAVDNKGALPAAITSTATDMKSATGGANICSDLVATYIAALPVDPSTGSFTSCSEYETGYTIVKDATTNRVTVSAPSTEGDEAISVTR